MDDTNPLPQQLRRLADNCGAISDSLSLIRASTPATMLSSRHRRILRAAQSVFTRKRNLFRRLAYEMEVVSQSTQLPGFDEI